MAFYLIGSYINSIDDSTMQQLNAMSDPAANIYQESLIKGFFNCGIELIPYSFKVVSKKLYSQYSLFYKSWKEVPIKNNAMMAAAIDNVLVLIVVFCFIVNHYCC